MGIAVIDAIIEKFVGELEVREHRGEGIVRDDDIGGDAATVFHGASCLRVEDAAEGIGEMEGLAVFTPTLEIARLDAAT